MIYPADFNYGGSDDVARKNAGHIFGKPEWPRQMRNTSRHNLQPACQRKVAVIGFPVVRFSGLLRGNAEKKSHGKVASHRVKMVKPAKKDSSDDDGSVSLWRLYCTNTTIHGFKYLADRTVPWFER